MCTGVGGSFNIVTCYTRSAECPGNSGPPVKLIFATENEVIPIINMIY